MRTCTEQIAQQAEKDELVAQPLLHPDQNRPSRRIASIPSGLGMLPLYALIAAFPAPLVLRPALGQVPYAEQGKSTIPPRSRVPRFDFERPVKAAQRGLHPTQVLAGHPEVPPRRCTARV